MKDRYNFNDNDEVDVFRRDMDIFISEQDEHEYSIVYTSMRFKALIDKEYTDEVRQYRWYGTVNDGGVYASSDIDGKRIYLQNFIYEKKTGIKAHGVSFENKVSLDCRFANLRGVSRTEVMNNRRPKINTTSKFKGVRWDPVKEKWRVEIRPKGEYFYLGRFDKEKEEFAAKVYDAAARKLMVGSAYLNFPSDPKLKKAEEIVTKLLDRRRKRKLEKLKKEKRRRKNV